MSLNQFSGTGDFHGAGANPDINAALAVVAFVAGRRLVVLRPQQQRMKILHYSAFKLVDMKLNAGVSTYNSLRYE
ncbi:MAG: hypothetical protein ABIO19_16740 [Burkholderiaceae bacterium]